MAQEIEKRNVEEIFRDFKATNNIKDARIISINLFKKFDKIEITLEIYHRLKLKEIVNFEQYISVRFGIGNVSIKLEYDENVKFDTIENMWQEIKDYISIKHPITKVILKNSKIEENNSEIKIILEVSGAEFLIARGIEKNIEEILWNIYGKRYKVRITEKIVMESENLMLSKAKKDEEKAIRIASSEIMEVLEKEKQNEVTTSNKENVSDTKNQNKAIEKKPEIERKSKSRRRKFSINTWSFVEYKRRSNKDNRLNSRQWKSSFRRRKTKSRFKGIKKRKGFSYF